LIVAALSELRDIKRERTGIALTAVGMGSSPDVLCAASWRCAVNASLGETIIDSPESA
jgi:hypothetical protein